MDTGPRTGPNSDPDGRMAYVQALYVIASVAVFVFSVILVKVARHEMVPPAAGTVGSDRDSTSARIGAGLPAIQFKMFSSNNSVAGSPLEPYRLKPA